jgi:hypothetical protein
MRSTRYFDQLQQELGIKSPEDWYKFTSLDVVARKGKGLLYNYYGGSLIKALHTVYPEYTLLPWLFERVPRNFWKDMGNQRKFFDWLAKELDILTPSDWYRVSANAIVAKGGGGLLDLCIL